MQIKEYEAYNLKDCLQQVRNDLGADAVILETRKFRKGGLLGWGAKDAVRIVAAVGITVQNDLPPKRNGNGASEKREPVAVASQVEGRTQPTREEEPVALTPPMPRAASAAARNAYARAGGKSALSTEARPTPRHERTGEEPTPLRLARESEREEAEAPLPSLPAARKQESGASRAEVERLATLERTITEIRDTLLSLQREHRDSQEKTVTAVVSAVAPAINAVTNAAEMVAAVDAQPTRFPDLLRRLTERGVSDLLAYDLLDSLPDFSAWSEEARPALAEAALRDLIANRVPRCSEIKLTPKKLKAVALIGPTGVGKTTTIAKLAAHFALVEKKKVALLTVDTYRIAAVDQLKTYGQIIDIPIAVAYSENEVLQAVEQFAKFDLLLIDTAGRSQHNIAQVGELKSLLEALQCETHLVLSAPVKERDMLEAAERFSAARVDRLLFTKLDETTSYGTLLNVADRTGIPLSYLTNGQKVPEDIEPADGAALANLILD